MAAPQYCSIYNTNGGSVFDNTLKFRPYLAGFEGFLTTNPHFPLYFCKLSSNEKFIKSFANIHSLSLKMSKNISDTKYAKFCNACI